MFHLFYILNSSSAYLILSESIFNTSLLFSFWIYFNYLNSIFIWKFLFIYYLYIYIYDTVVHIHWFLVINWYARQELDYRMCYTIEFTQKILLFAYWYWNVWKVKSMIFFFCLSVCLNSISYDNSLTNSRGKFVLEQKFID